MKKIIEFTKFFFQVLVALIAYSFFVYFISLAGQFFKLGEDAVTMIIVSLPLAAVLIWYGVSGYMGVKKNQLGRTVEMSDLVYDIKMIPERLRKLFKSIFSLSLQATKLILIFLVVIALIALVVYGLASLTPIGIIIILLIMILLK